ncbi:PfkB family carbohydrate kinase [Acerihabitans arboris]|uniref:Helix-turn-helix domain-containing protein n=1 Tax=Acerihabitans arboris TaxID=2691583 RepID=A0A845SJV3_9GAMM|nr:PfkB family carbohydrate kinase [Acerihabitans arboris]NDL63244.1 helix-turn-helix domain-containing protein [Acerihabitans arboris]
MHVNIIHEMLQWLELYLEKGLSLDAVSEKVGYSKWHLQREFKKKTGRVLGHYIRERRLSKTALALRLTHRSVLNIALHYNFDSQQTFTRAFKRQFGMPPGSYRRGNIADMTEMCPPIQLPAIAPPEPEFIHLPGKQLQGVTHRFSSTLEQYHHQQERQRRLFWESYLAKMDSLPPVVYGLRRSQPSRDKDDELVTQFATALSADETLGDASSGDAIYIQPGQYALFRYVGGLDRLQDFILSLYKSSLPSYQLIGTGCSYKFGGKGGNQAIAAAKAGAGVAFLGAVGADDNGRFLIATLRDCGVDTTHIETIGSIASGMSVAMTDAEGDYGAIVVSAANTRINTDRLAHDDVWSGVGMLILQNEVPESVNLSAAREARRRKIMVCLNAAPATALSADFERCIDVLAVNSVEARDMSGVAVNDLDSAGEAVLALKARFPIVMVTAGGHGVAFSDIADAYAFFPAEPVELVSTHGAGDCFMGTFCQAFNDGAPLGEAIKAANHAAAKHVSQPKTDS